MLIIKNEKQERKIEINESALRGQFTNLKKTLATNFKTNRGLENILTNIEDYIKKLHLKIWILNYCDRSNEIRRSVKQTLRAKKRISSRSLKNNSPQHLVNLRYWLRKSWLMDDCLGKETRTKTIRFLV
ncbi:MAG: hypothetical protein QNJ55_26265 [Xenococcus sp. MO_188.B8]|nr:hypothetical protein [Xenococcus sp. MO_188.B8]